MRTEVNFGRFRGKGLTLPQIVLRDPDWFFWAFENNAFKGALAKEAVTIANRARRIKIPKPAPEEWEVEYLITHDGKYGTFEIVPEDRELHVGSSTPVRSKYLDLSFPRRVKSYDKSGGRLFIDGLKYHLFGKSNARVTRQRCEDFFDDLRTLDNQTN
jgi:hypothetical protein